MVENWGLLDFSLLFLHAASCAVGTIGTVILYDNENINKPFDLKLTEAGFNVCSSTSQTGCTLCVQNLESVSDTLSHPLAKNWCIVSVIMTIHILEWNRYPLMTLHDYNAQELQGNPKSFIFCDRFCHLHTSQPGACSVFQSWRKGRRPRGSESLCCPAGHCPDVPVHLWWWTSCRAEASLNRAPYAVQVSGSNIYSTLTVFRV